MGESFFRHFNAYNASSTETQSTILGDNCNKVLLCVKRQIYRTSLMQNFVLRPKHIHSFLVKALIDSASPFRSLPPVWK